ncbi:hypothetical protein psal_cds_737 [Pandoravirus salinus]|uniref:Uncharacterized protein n=1 Tax=Pandoravirus salinus TaxID=1349410 RepID=S4W399_9VIRU|nr:hypothetical protein psal_cds_737 [Pandoravirus salinus]AGO84720.2 hypothetical protein psal_cds_737 [Pandoravirus salinus]
MACNAHRAHRRKKRSPCEQPSGAKKDNSDDVVTDNRHSRRARHKRHFFSDKKARPFAVDTEPLPSLGAATTIVRACWAPFCQQADSNFCEE